MRIREFDLECPKCKNEDTINRFMVESRVREFIKEIEIEDGKIKELEKIQKISGWHKVEPTNFCVCRCCLALFSDEEIIKHNEKVIAEKGIKQMYRIMFEIKKAKEEGEDFILVESYNHSATLYWANEKYLSELGLNVKLADGSTILINWS